MRNLEHDEFRELSGHLEDCLTRHKVAADLANFALAGVLADIALAYLKGLKDK